MGTHECRTENYHQIVPGSDTSVRQLHPLAESRLPRSSRILSSVVEILVPLLRNGLESMKLKVVLTLVESTELSGLVEWKEVEPAVVQTECQRVPVELHEIVGTRKSMQKR